MARSDVYVQSDAFHRVRWMGLLEKIAGDAHVVAILDGWSGGDRTRPG